MARNRTFNKLQKEIENLNLTSSQREGLNEIFNTLSRRYFQLELSARRESKRTSLTSYKGAQLAVKELSSTFNGENVLLERA
jgi:plastocyanin domain-containing protein